MMNNLTHESEFKRHVAYKTRIGDILAGNTIFDNEKLKFVEIGDKHLSRVNIIANIIDKYVQDGEKKFASVTLDDASGQIKLKLFGEDIKKFDAFAQGDTIIAIGLLRSWNNEIYITPEIIKKRDTSFLIIRKLETDLERPKPTDKSELNVVRDNILQTIKINDNDGGVETEKLVLEIKASPDIINTEIRKLLEDGLIYEPRPGKLRYLG